jgi:DNA-binding response OmpR family regulator
MRNHDLAAAGVTVLIVESDRRIAVSLSESLTQIGYRHLLATTGADALRLARVATLVLLDTALADMDGFDVCRTIRNWSDVPIVMLSGQGEEADRVLGFELGTDDYVTKPFSVRELMCRVRAVLRRTGACHDVQSRSAQTVVFGQVRIEPWLREVRRNGKRLDLYPSEYDLLWLLVRNPGQVFRPEELSHLAGEPLGCGSKNAVRTRMCLLRIKVEEDPAHPRYLRTLRGGGYFFQPASDTAAR